MTKVNLSFVLTLVLLQLCNIFAKPLVGPIANEKPCPFSNVCSCLDAIPPDPYIFDEAKCKSNSSFPTFTAPADHKYKVNVLVISGKTDVIPANAFQAFYCIERLAIFYGEDGTGTPVPQHWDQKAFLDTQLYTFAVNGLSNVLPLPAYLNGITYLDIVNAGLVEVPKNVNYEQLYSLSLMDNNIQSIKKDDFRNAAKLNFLILANNPITNIEAGAFLPLTKATSFDLSESNLTGIDLSIFPYADSTVSWALDNCKLLKTLTVSDISKVSQLF
jgi:hypothetical protein